MFNNIGGKCKGLARFLCWVGIICSVIGAIVLFVYGAKCSYRDYIHPFVGYGFLVLIVGPLSSWIGSWVIYAIGEAAENSVSINHDNKAILKKLESIEGGNGNTVTKPSSLSAKNFKLSKLDEADSAHETWKCDMCNSVNPASAKHCLRCNCNRQ